MKITINRIFKNFKKSCKDSNIELEQYLYIEDILYKKCLEYLLLKKRIRLDNKSILYLKEKKKYKKPPTNLENKKMSAIMLMMLAREKNKKYAFTKERDKKININLSCMKMTDKQREKTLMPLYYLKPLKNIIL